MRILPLGAAAIATAALLAACGSTGGAGPLVSPSASPSSSAAQPPIQKPPGRTQPPSTTLETLQGTVTTGVEGGCLILNAAGGKFELIGGDTSVVRANAKVVVRGYRTKGLMSHCMQGTMFQVVSAQPAS